MIKRKIALICTQGNLLNREQVCHKIYLWISKKKKKKRSGEWGEVSKQYLNSVKQEFSTGSDSAPQGWLAMSRDILLVVTPGRLLLAFSG